SRPRALPQQHGRGHLHPLRRHEGCKGHRGRGGHRLRCGGTLARPSRGLPRRPQRGRGPPIGRVIDFQLLAYKVEVSVEDERLDAVLAYLANSADQPLVPRAVMRYAVVGGGPYAIYEEGDYLAAVEHPDDVLYVIYARCHARLLDYLSLGQWVALHAGVVSIGDRRALVIGARGTGKTTLMLRLLFDRYAVEGDELVFTRAGKAVSLPRNFHVKPGAVKPL